MQISTIPLPLWLNYSLPHFSCSQPLCLPQRRCRIREAGWTDSVCRGEEGGKHSRAESFQSLFFLQPPLIDGSNGTSLNTTLISGSKQNILKASSCRVKTANVFFPQLFDWPVFHWFSSVFFFSLFCVSSLPGSFLLSSLFCQYIYFVVLPSLICAFCMFAVHTENPSLPSVRAL